MSDEKPMGQVIQIDEARIRDHLGEMVRGTVEETLASRKFQSTIRPVK
jgi:putative transposase